MGKPLALDLFCGGGGACLGMMQAGFEVVGVDIEIHTCYPGQFIQADISKLPVRIDDFDFVWASPPCQSFSTCNNGHLKKLTADEIARRYPNYIPLTRKLLAHHPFTVIENVPHAPIRPDVVLTGQMFGLERIDRVRWFETSFPLLTPPLVKATLEEWQSGKMVTVTSTAGNSATNCARRKRLGLPSTPPISEKKEALGLPEDWQMTHKQVGNCVPPPYARFIATEALKQIIQQRKRTKSYPSNFETI